MKRYCFATVVLWLLSGTAAGQCVNGMCPVAPTAPAKHPAVARIVNQKQDGRYLGSGTLVEKDDARGLIVTCAHLFRDGVGRVTVAFADGRVFDANVLATDRQWDLAALEIAPPAASPVEIAAEAPQPGEWLQSCGYGADGRYRCNQGQARGYVQTVGTSGPETLELSGSARQGDSGGPVFNRQGQLAAVLWGTDGRTVGGTYCGRVRAFLAGVLRCRRTPTPEPRVTERPVATDTTGTGTSPSPSDAGNNVDRGSEPVPRFVQAVRRASGASPRPIGENRGRHVHRGKAGPRQGSGDCPTGRRRGAGRWRVVGVASVATGAHGGTGLDWPAGAGRHVRIEARRDDAAPTRDEGKSTTDGNGVINQAAQ